MKTFQSQSLTAGALLLALSGCSPHPAAGTWTTQPGETQPFGKLAIQYEGRADLYSTGAQEAERHCFWGGKSRESVSLTCVPAINTEVREHYRFTVGEDGTGTLSRNDEVIARFTRTPG